MGIIFFNIFFVFFLFIAVFVIVFTGKGQLMGTVQFIWPLGIVVILLLGIMNVVYLLNRKLLILLEQQNWPGLTAYLEQKLYKEGRYTPRYVKLMVQSCLATGNFDGAVNLKNRLAVVKPALVEDNALIFGIAYLLGENTAGKTAADGTSAGISASAVDFFEERLEKGMSGHMNWLCWYYGFSLTLIGDYEKAGAVLVKLAADMPKADMPKAYTHDILVTGLAAFVLSELTGKSPAAPAEWRICAEEGKSRVRKTLKTAKKWTKKAEKLKTEAHGAVIRSYLDRAGAWIWGSN